MNTEICESAELGSLREVFVFGSEEVAPAGWEAVWSFEAEHGVLFPGPCRMFVVEVCGGLRVGPSLWATVDSRAGGRGKTRWPRRWHRRQRPDRGDRRLGFRG